MNRLFRSGRIAVAALVALTIGAGAAVTAGPAAAASSCTTANAKLYLPSTYFPYYRLNTSSYACYVGAERIGWYTYSMKHWRCGDFNCHSFWLKYRK